MLRNWQQDFIFTMIRKILLFCAIVCIIDETVLTAADKIVCYHGIWSAYREGDGKFTVEDIDPTLCTHAVYAFVGIDNDGNVRHLDSFLDIHKGNLNRFNALKLRSKNLKTLVAIGESESLQLSVVTANATKRATLVKSVVDFVKMWRFDGLSLDLKLPVQDEIAATVDKQNLANLVQELKEEFDKHGLLLTAALGASLDSVNLASDVPTLFQNLDIINVMVYDFNKSWEGITDQNIFRSLSSAYPIQNQQLRNVDATIREWIKGGVDPQKITLGLETFGKAYNLSNNSSVGRKSYITEPEVVGYNEIVELQTQGGWTNLWDHQENMPYMYKNDQWISYDNPISIGYKVDYAKFLNLGGIAVWCIETDDFKGISGTEYPLLMKVNQVLGRTSEVEEVEPVPGAGIQNVCTEEGYVRDPIDCGVYYYCLFYNNAFIPWQLKCNSGLYFDKENLRCDYPHNVPC